MVVFLQVLSVVSKGSSPQSSCSVWSSVGTRVVYSPLIASEAYDLDSFTQWPSRTESAADLAVKRVSSKVSTLPRPFAHDPLSCRCQRWEQEEVLRRLQLVEWIFSVDRIKVGKRHYSQKVNVRVQWMTLKSQRQSRKRYPGISSFHHSAAKIKEVFVVSGTFCWF